LILPLVIIYRLHALRAGLLSARPESSQRAAQEGGSDKAAPLLRNSPTVVGDNAFVWGFVLYSRNRL
jgi:hypothetical protein